MPNAASETLIVRSEIILDSDSDSECRSTALGLNHVHYLHNSGANRAPKSSKKSYYHINTERNHTPRRLRS